MTRDGAHLDDGPATAEAGSRLPTRPVRAVRPAVPVELRSLVAVLVGVSVLGVVALAVGHRGSHGPDAFDRVVGPALRTVWPRAGDAAYAVDGLAAPVPAALLVAVLVLACVLARRWRLAVLAAVGPLAGAAVATALKPLVGRTIHGENLAFPSGHTAFATGVGLLLGLVLVAWTQLRRAAAAALLLGLTLVTGVGMAVDQVALDAHYPTDTAGGLLTAVAVVGLAALLVDVLVELLAARARRGGRPPRTALPAG